MRKYLYADESGNFDFSRRTGATKYFILTTALILDHKIATDLMDLRLDLVWKRVSMKGGSFHATEDKQLVRDAVFSVIDGHDFRVDATILEKAKASPNIRPTDMRFYKYAWYFHMKYVAPRVASTSDEVMVIAASISTKSKQSTFHDAIADVMEQVSPTSALESTVWPAAVDPCLQVADYCSWAIQRKWESGDDRAYNLIKAKIGSEYDLFKPGSVEYY